VIFKEEWVGGRARVTITHAHTKNTQNIPNVQYIKHIIIKVP